MLLKQDDGTCIAGPADILCILKLPAGTFHVAFFEVYPMPGPVKPIDELDILRLKSRAHHTIGGKTLEEAQIHLAEMRAKIILPDENVVGDKEIEVNDPVNIWILPNWKKENKTLRDVLIK